MNKSSVSSSWFFVHMRHFRLDIYFFRFDFIRFFDRIFFKWLENSLNCRPGLVLLRFFSFALPFDHVLHESQFARLTSDLSHCFD